MGWGDSSYLTIQTLLFLSVICGVFVSCDEIEKRDVHRIILRGGRRPRSHRNHRHHHYKGFNRNTRDQDRSHESVFEPYSSEFQPNYRSKSKDRGRVHKHQHDSREKHREHSYENDGYRDASRSHENSFEDFHNYKAHSHHKPLITKRPHFSSQSLEFDETRPEANNDWTPLQFVQHETRHSHHSNPHKSHKSHKSKRNKSKKEPNNNFKMSPFVELTTAFPQKVPFLVYDNTEYPFLDASNNRGFNSKAIDSIGAPILNLQTIQTLTQQKTIPNHNYKRSSYEIKESPIDTTQLRHRDSFNMLAPNIAQTLMEVVAESKVKEEIAKDETTTEKPTTSRSRLQRGVSKLQRPK